jgi:hypothetical protein
LIFWGAKSLTFHSLFGLHLWPAILPLISISPRRVARQHALSLVFCCLGQPWIRFLMKKVLGLWNQVTRNSCGACLGFSGRSCHLGVLNLWESLRLAQMLGIQALRKPCYKIASPS